MRVLRTKTETALILRNELGEDHVIKNSLDHFIEACGRLWRPETLERIKMMRDAFSTPEIING